jgi:hypothetical protein
MPCSIRERQVQAFESHIWLWAPTSAALVSELITSPAFISQQNPDHNEYKSHRHVCQTFLLISIKEQTIEQIWPKFLKIQRVANSSWNNKSIYVKLTYFWQCEPFLPSRLFHSFLTSNSFAVSSLHIHGYVQCMTF